MTAILTTLLIYTMPSNAVFVLILLLLYRSKAIFIGCILALILYTPLIGGMLSDPQIQNNLFRTETFTQTFPEVLNAFISYRWLLLPLIAWGLLNTRKTHWKPIVICLVMLTVPFLIFFIQGGTVYGRMFLPMLPFFCLLGAIGLDNTGMIK